MLTKVSQIQNERFTRDIVAELIAGKRSENTKRAYKRDIADFFNKVLGMEATPGLVHRFLTLKRFDAVTVVQKYKTSLIEAGLAEATINRRISAVRSLVSYARTVGLCDWGLEDIKGEKIQSYRDTSGVTVDQIANMLQVPDRDTVKGKRDYAILRIFWELALRRGEISKLNVEDFDAEAHSLSVLGKGMGTQKEMLTLSEKAVEAINDWLSARDSFNASDPLFIALDNANKGHRITGEGLSKLVKTVAKQAGIKKVLSPHRIRHSSITAALEATNGNVSKVQKLSRHAKVETVMIYEDRRVNQQKQVTNLLSNLA